jgi:hypothetical protein
MLHGSLNLPPVTWTPLKSPCPDQVPARSLKTMTPSHDSITAGQTTGSISPRRWTSPPAVCTFVLQCCGERRVLYSAVSWTPCICVSCFWTPCLIPGMLVKTKTQDDHHLLNSVLFFLCAFFQQQKGFLPPLLICPPLMSDPVSSLQGEITHLNLQICSGCTQRRFGELEISFSPNKVSQQTDFQFWKSKASFSSCILDNNSNISHSNEGL